LAQTLLLLIAGRDNWRWGQIKRKNKFTKQKITRHFQLQKSAGLKLAYCISHPEWFSQHCLSLTSISLMRRGSLKMKTTITATNMKYSHYHQTNDYLPQGNHMPAGKGNKLPFMRLLVNVSWRFLLMLVRLEWEIFNKKMGKLLKKSCSKKC